MYRGRPKVWAMFLIVCLISQLLITSTPAIVATVKQTYTEINLELEAKKQERIEREQARLEAEKEQQSAQTQQETTSSESNSEKEMTDEERAEEMISSMLEIVLLVSKYIGTLIMIYGMFNFVLAFRNEDAEMRSRAISMLVVGCVLVGANVIVPTILGVGVNTG